MSDGAIEYPVRTPPLYWVVVGALIALAAGCAGLLLFGLRHALSWLLLALTALVIAAPALYLAGTREYRVRGAIVLRVGSIVVPDHRGTPLGFDAARVRMTVTPVVVRFTLLGIGIGDMSRGTVLTFEAAGTRRRLSTLTLVDPDQTAALLADLQRVLQGEAPRGPHAVDLGGGPPVEPDRYRDQLERELAALD
ncbi:MAG: hypothetical protein R3B09_20290 [Nannocystaceae bacterium]